ncbi:hypothetical protein [Deinococcus sp.]|uniref:hypothetical protein n=1 Tax=Deinococcus sp. TaxID=47478 RepID=UPI003B5BAB2A
MNTYSDFMRPWMLEAPESHLTDAHLAAFASAWTARDVDLLPEDVPRWLFLQWLTQQGFLLHGSRHPGITCFEPRTPVDFSPDDFSKRTGVFAASDGLWAMMYALKSDRVRRIMNMALQIADASGWASMRYFLSFASDDPTVKVGRDLLAPGFVYVLPRDGFVQMPPYLWPNLAEVLEPHWINPAAVTPLLCLPVMPNDFPLPVRTHDAARVAALIAADPWGFPWLAEGEQ